MDTHEHSQNPSAADEKRTPHSPKPTGAKPAMILKAMALYGELFPGFGESISPERGSLYCRLLDDLDAEALKHGLAQAAKTCTRFPTVADIRRCAAGNSAARLELEAEGALAALDALVAHWGVDRTPEYVGIALAPPDGFRRCPEIGGALGYALSAVGGWRVYAARDEKSSPFLRRDLIAGYKRAREAEAEGWSLLESGGGSLSGEIAAAAAGMAVL